MLTLYDSFDVPDVPNVKIYRDDQVPHRFYMVSERATVARDDEGHPIFLFILYARDVDKLPADQLEVERGYVAMTTQAAVTKEAEEKIRAFLRQKLADERSRRFRFLRNLVASAEPELGYPPLWLDGKVDFRVVPEDMVIKAAGSSVPSLIGTNVASFTAHLDRNGAELFRQSVEKGKNPSGVWYNLKFAARIPAITIRVVGDRGAFYDEVKNYVTKTWTHIQRTEFLGFTLSERRWTTTWSELSSISKFRSEFHNLRIEVDDSSLPSDERNEMKDKLEEMAFSIIQSNILPAFFEQALKDVGQQEKDPHAMIPVHESFRGSIDMTITRSQIVEKQANPNALLFNAMTTEEIKANTIYVDLSQTFFQELDVTVHPNVNFTEDPVFALKVSLDYDQKDDVRGEQIKRAKDFLFKQADQIGRWRVVLAKGSDGAPKDSYRYWSEVTYKDTGQAIRIPPSGAIESRERQLVISYRRLGFVKVNLTLGSLPDNVKSVQAQVNYPGISSPTAQQQFEMTREKPTASYFTYTGKTGEPGPYRYKFVYTLADGQKMETQEQESQAEVLVVPDPFERTMNTRFLAQADFSVVDKVLVDARYEDAANDLATNFHGEMASNGESVAWSLGLRDPNKLQFSYDVIVVFKNGSRQEQKGLAGTLGQTIPVGVGAVDALDVTVIGSLVDWSKYKIAIVSLKYDDANAVHEAKSFTFQQATSADQSWRVLLRDRSKKSYQYRIKLVAAAATDNREDDWKTTEEAVLVIQ
ncbi:MAG: hypothetical protein QUU85_08665 [Candidatus Eisenbacteria bacterium]|nr:hypothetical protein [Candidatus Eisenbacteria bacterium]